MLERLDDGPPGGTWKSYGGYCDVVLAGEARCAGIVFGEIKGDRDAPTTAPAPLPLPREGPGPLLPGCRVMLGLDILGDSCECAECDDVGRAKEGAGSLSNLAR